MTKKYAKSGDGAIHLISDLNGEITLCGNAFEGLAMNGEPTDDAWVDHDSGPVTCPECIREIMNCRGVRCKS
jgi:hypothetical protein